MDRYFYRSLIGEVSDGINRLISDGTISTGKSIVIYGLDRYSFAMRTILQHRGYEVSAYITEDEAQAVRIRREMADIACRYFKSDRDIISILCILEKSFIQAMKSMNQPIILIADKNYVKIKSVLESFGYKENEKFYKVTDFSDGIIDELLKNKTQLSLDELKNTEKNMLAVLDDYCIKNGLRYWVCGGTLLGAMRHKGFIPWDDDIDIFLPYKDYCKLLNEFPKDKGYSFVGCGTPYGDMFMEVNAMMLDDDTILDHHVKIVRRICGVWVDIFPLIGLPTDEKERILYFRHYQELEKSIVQDFYASDGDLNIFKKRHPEQVAFLDKYDFDSSEYVGVLGTKYGERDCTRRSVYSGTFRQPFEDIEVNAPIGYDEYLSNLYGDNWNEIPDKSKQTSGHAIKAYRL